MPSEIDGRPEIGIGENCFNSNMDIVDVALPESIKIIGDNAFAFSALEEVAFDADEYMYIGNGDFSATGVRHMDMRCRMRGTPAENNAQQPDIGAERM